MCSDTATAFRPSRPEAAVDRFAQSKAIFLEAVQLPRLERIAFVEQRCAGDPDLHREVLDLLLHWSDGGATLEAALEVDLAVDAEEHGAGQVFGDYTLLEVLGRGGMGVVYRARVASGTEVALKRLRPGLVSRALLERFAREAEVLRRLDHPGIARLIDAGVFETAGGPTPYIATELMPGPTLRQWAAAKHSRAERCTLLAGIADAVAAAHAAGVIHRDLKPENVIVAPDGTPRLLDFGVARIIDSAPDGQTMTTAGIVLGTLRYMSPEQAEAKPGPIDGRADVYAIGVMAYELLTGRLPYELPEDSLHRALVAILTSPPDLAALDVDSAAVLRRALAKDPGNRHADATGLAEDLRALAAGRRPEARARELRAARPRQVLITVGWMIGLALAGLAARRLSMHVPIGPAEEHRILEGVIAQLDTIDSRLHGGARTRPGIVFADSMCGQVRAALVPLAGRPSFADLTAYAWWREGEGHFFLGDRYGLPDELERAAECWSRAAQDDRPTGSPPRLPDTTLAIMDRIQSMSSVQAQGAVAAAYQELARYRAPHASLEQALPPRRLALEGVIRALCDGGDSLNAVPRTPEPALCFALNDVGETYSALGENEVNGPLLDLALRFLHRADSLGYARMQPEPHASLQQHLGITWLRLSRLRRDPASADSAGSHLRFALALREAISDNVSRLDTRITLADCLRWRARMYPAMAAASLREAEQVLEAARRPEYCETSERQHDLLDFADARVRTDIALLAHSPERLRAAQPALDRLLLRMPRGEVPVLHAEVAFERARLRAALGLLTNDAAMINLSGIDTDEAKQSIRREQSPWLHERVNQCRIQVLRGGTMPVSLTYPAEW